MLSSQDLYMRSKAPFDRFSPTWSSLFAMCSLQEIRLKGRGEVLAWKRGRFMCYPLMLSYSHQCSDEFLRYSDTCTDLFFGLQVRHIEGHNVSSTSPFLHLE